MHSRHFHILSIISSVVSLALILLSFFISSQILAGIEVILAASQLTLYAILKRKKVAFRFFDYAGFVVLPLFCAVYAIQSYELFGNYASFLSVTLCVGIILTVIAYSGESLKKRALEIAVSFVFFSVSAFGVTAFANVELDPHEITPVQGTVTQKLVSSGFSDSGRCFLLDVQTESYGTLRVAATYKQSRACEIGDSVELSVGHGLFGEGYYYYGFIGEKERYDWRFSIPDDDEFYNYADSLPFIS